MKTTKTMFARFFAVSLIALTLATPTLVQAGRGHHHGHHHGHRHHNHHLNGYMMYNQPRIQYRSYYPQPSYNYYPAPVYVQPSMIGGGINYGGGGAAFVIGF